MFFQSGFSFWAFFRCCHHLSLSGLQQELSLHKTNHGHDHSSYSLSPASSEFPFQVPVSHCSHYELLIVSLTNWTNPLNVCLCILLYPGPRMLFSFVSFQTYYLLRPKIRCSLCRQKCYILSSSVALCHPLILSVYDGKSLH